MRHHILPRALGGGDEPENLIRLTAEDHFFAHLLLAKAHGGKQWAPLIIMLRPARQVGISSRGRRARCLVGFVRQQFAESQVGVPRPDVSAKLKGVAKSAAAKLAMSHAARGKIVSAETRAKMADASRGRVFTDERNAKVSASKMGDRNPAKRPEVRAAIAAKARLRTGASNPRYSNIIYRFRQEDGRVVSATKYDMARQFGLNRTCLNYVITGKRKATKGWLLFTG